MSRPSSPARLWISDVLPAPVGPTTRLSAPRAKRTGVVMCRRNGSAAGLVAVAAGELVGVGVGLVGALDQMKSACAKPMSCACAAGGAGAGVASKASRSSVCG